MQLAKEGGLQRRRHAQLEDRTEYIDAQREPLRRPPSVCLRREAPRLRVQPRVERVADLADPLEDGADRRHRERMLAEGAGKVRARGLREALVAKGPLAAVDAVHELSDAADRADGHAATERLAVRDQVGAHAKVLLRAADADAQAGDDLVEDEDDTAV